MKKPVNPYPIILDLLTRGLAYAPHEVRMQLGLMGCHVAPEACTARMRDLRKAQYGGHNLKKRKRADTDYFEYWIELPQQAQEAA